MESTTPTGRLAVSPAEAATLLGVSATTIRRWIAAGTMPSTKLGGNRLICLADLQSLMTTPDSPTGLAADAGGAA